MAKHEVRDAVADPPPGAVGVAVAEHDLTVRAQIDQHRENVHLIDPATGVYNKHLVKPGLTLAKGWQRMQGFVYRKGDARFERRTFCSGLREARGEDHGGADLAPGAGRHGRRFWLHGSNRC